MTTETKNVKEVTPLKAWMNTLTVEEYPDKRKEVIDKCKINDQIFRNWRNGLTNVYELAKPIINEIAGYEVYKMEEV